MRIIRAEEISETVCELFIKANTVLPDDMREAIVTAAEKETDARAKRTLEALKKNWEIAEKTGLPICQDTGMAVVFLDVGREAHVEGSTPEEAVNEGVRRGYERGYLRKSIVSDPLRRINTGDNTPAVVHIRFVEGDRLQITAAPKGFGSENMSAVKLFAPSAEADDIIEFAVKTVCGAGANPCPPVVLGIGIGGTLEMACVQAKRALLRPLSERNGDDYYAALEDKILKRLNCLGIGPQGLGGATTALGVAIETFPTHIAGLPVAVNISCHANRHVSAVI